MVKMLDGKKLAKLAKERQTKTVQKMRARKVFPKLVIIRDSDNPVILKYVGLKKRYGEDIGVEVVDQKIDAVDNSASLSAAKAVIKKLNQDKTVSGIIVQLPLASKEMTDEVVNMITPEKDVDGLSGNLARLEQENDDLVLEKTGQDSANSMHVERKFESATATAITWLLAGNDIALKNKKVALVGYGRLVGQPLKRIFDAAKIPTEVFRSKSDLSALKNYDVIITATGVPHLIKSEMVKPEAVIVDAGTASEDGVLIGDVDKTVRERSDLAAITPKIGGVGPLTVSSLFENVIKAADDAAKTE